MYVLIIELAFILSYHYWQIGFLLDGIVVLITCAAIYIVDSTSNYQSLVENGPSDISSTCDRDICIFINITMTK